MSKHEYTTQQPEDYAWRLIVRHTYKGNEFNTHIYTTNPDKNEAFEYLKEKLDQAELIYCATKEQDDAAAKFCKEMFGDE